MITTVTSVKIMKTIFQFFVVKQIKGLKNTFFKTIFVTNVRSKDTPVQAAQDLSQKKRVHCNSLVLVKNRYVICKCRVNVNIIVKAFS